MGGKGGGAGGEAPSNRLGGWREHAEEVASTESGWARTLAGGAGERLRHADDCPAMRMRRVHEGSRKVRNEAGVPHVRARLCGHDGAAGAAQCRGAP